jgi:hypothetical protein
MEMRFSPILPVGPLEDDPGRIHAAGTCAVPASAPQSQDVDAIG